MNIIRTKIDGVLILESQLFRDNRGFFAELLTQKELDANSIDFKILQVNHSLSTEMGTLRGLHFQIKPFQQKKIVCCPKGVLFDVAVDLRPQSPTFLQYLTFVMVGSENHIDSIGSLANIPNDYIIHFPNKVLIPDGFAHGFLTLTPNSEILYFLDNFYSKKCERTIRYDDPKINIQWPDLGRNFILSEKDKKAPYFVNFDISELL
jgi:dTDP-4-dehydrorhamnose 3,5-epimerase-like enzyme